MSRPMTPGMSHGTKSAYVNYGCRCDACCAAGAAARRQLRESQTSRGLPDENDRRHGTPSGYSNWGCRCDRCREAHTVKERTLRQAARPTPTHPPKSTHPLWQTYVGMISRCTNPSAQNYAYYGGRGISVCDEWRADFWTFVADVGERPEGTTLDRIDNDGPYSPENCRWATASVQQSNKRPRRSVAAGVLVVPAIADQSNMPVFGWQAWAIFIIAVAVVLGGWALVIQIMTAPTSDPEPSQLDRLDGEGRVL